MIHWLGQGLGICILRNLFKSEAQLGVQLDFGSSDLWHVSQSVILEPSPELSTNVNVGYNRGIVSEIRKGPVPPGCVLDRTHGDPWMQIWACLFQTGWPKSEGARLACKKEGKGLKEEMFDFSQGHPL